jgi:site-specific DNA-cytosine methylase
LLPPPLGLCCRHLSRTRVRGPAAAGGKPKPSNNNTQPPYLDTPFDVTDRGVAHIVTDQARKMEPLLLEALQAKELRPVELQTLCSGTDAPAIALSLVCKELAPRLGAAGASLEVHHSMSCESEPFKQAYIARNFPQVVLFADVVELAEKAAAAAAAGKAEPGMATTSFGGLRPIPKADGSLSLLVAGTSCKDFSARKRATGVKKDIEDMGTSGETFIAAVDFLFAQQHDLMLLENVCGAPWEKMASYITGRVQLAATFAKFRSAQKGGETKKDEDEDGNGGAKGEKIETVLEREGSQLVVSSVAPLHGLRLGAVLRSYRQRGSKSDVPIDMKTLGVKEGKGIELKALCKKLGLPLQDKESVLLFDMPAKYQTKLIRVDTKLYGLPHTRNRNYMLAWKEGTYGTLSEVEVGDAWEEMVRGLQTALDHPVEAFMLPDASDRIRRFRDVLRSPIAQRVAKDHQGGDYYTTDRDADTRYNIGYRNCCHLLTTMDRNRKSVHDCQKVGANMAVDARPLTQWGPGKPPSLLSHLWMQDIVQFWSQHSLDHIDVKAVKNAESGVDMLHHNVRHKPTARIHHLPQTSPTPCLAPPEGRVPLSYRSCST